MKHITLTSIIICLLFSTPIFAQSNINQNDFELLDCRVIETPALYPGGLDSLRKFLSDSTVYPAALAQDDISGKVVVSFIIDKQGNVTEPTVLFGVCPVLSQEVRRVICLMKPWVPATRNGRKIIYRHIQSFTFSLTDEPGEKQESKNASDKTACKDAQYF